MSAAILLACAFDSVLLTSHDGDSPGVDGGHRTSLTSWIWIRRGDAVRDILIGFIVGTLIGFMLVHK